jgi:hypothetical protein
MMLHAELLLRMICTEYDTWLKIQFICSSREACLEYVEGEVYQSFQEEDFDSAAAPGVTLPEFKSANF